MRTQLPISYATEIERPPNQRWFGRTLLHLFESFTRKEFITQFAQQPPPVDMGLPYIKEWWDTAAAELEPEGQYEYIYAGQDKDGNATMQTATITNAAAAEPNIPGEYDYPEYVFPPTQAFIASPDGNMTQLIPANRLSSHATAIALLDEIRRDVPEFRGILSQSMLDGTFFRYVYELDDPELPDSNFKETRRLWQISNDASGGFINVGRMLRKKYAQGRGAPGHFAVRPKSRTSQLIWVSELALEDKTGTLPLLPVPSRPLAADEELVRRSPFDPGSVQVNSEPNPNEVAVSGSGGGGMSRKVYDLLVQLAAKFGIEVDD